MRYVAIVIVAVGLLSGRTLESSQVWSLAPVASWSDKQIQSLLSDSPWAGRAAVKPTGGGVNGYPKHKAIVTWESASLVRQARARAGLPSGTVDSIGGPEYAVSVRLWGTERALGWMGSPEMLMQRAALRRNGRPDLAPIGVERFLVDERGQLFAPLASGDRTGFDGRTTHDACGNRDEETPESPDPHVEHGGSLAISYVPCKKGAVFVFRFPATDPLAATENVEFVATLGHNVNVGLQTVTKAFQMSRMVVNGALDIR